MSKYAQHDLNEIRINQMENMTDAEDWVSLSVLPGYEAYARHAVSRDGRFLTETHRRIVTRPRTKTADGYVEVRLKAEGTKSRVRLAYLVALAYLSPRPSLAHILVYLDGDVTNCAADNLCWQVNSGIDLNATWKPVEGYPGYDISDAGQVTSTSIYQRRQAIKAFAAGARGGRAYVGMMRTGDRRREGHPLADLVAHHFLPPPPSKSHFLWYRDGNTFNCRADNLYWTERVELNLPMLDAETDEEWRNIAEWPDYHVSSHGRIRRAVMTSLMDSGARMEKHYTYRAKGRYVSVSLTRNKQKSQTMVHQLVCQAFHGPAPSTEHFVWFKDGNSVNCRADNLSWQTSREATALMDAKAGSTEEWQPISYYKNYEASTEGRVRHQNRDPRRIHDNHVLTAKLSPRGKLMTSVRTEGRSVPALVHTLVADAFLPPPPTKSAYIHHKDGDEANCRPENLEWMTHRQGYTQRYKERLSISDSPPLKSTS